MLIRCYDTRVFCAFGEQGGDKPTRVVREVKHCEMSLAASPQAARMGMGGPAADGGVKNHSNGDQTAQFFESIAPNGMTFFKLQELVL